MEGTIPVFRWKIDPHQFCSRFFAYLYDVVIPNPNKVVKKLDNLRMNFLWQGNKEKKDYNLVNWKTGKIEGLWGSET